MAVVALGTGLPGTYGSAGSASSVALSGSSLLQNLSFMIPNGTLCPKA